MIAFRRSTLIRAAASGPHERGIYKTGNPCFTFFQSLTPRLNALSAVPLICGFYFIRRRNITAHKTSRHAFGFLDIRSLSDLLSYVSLLPRGNPISRPWVRPNFLPRALLGSHTILAVVIVPLILTTLYRAWRERFDMHRRIAVWTLPLWIYVSHHWRRGLLDALPPEVQLIAVKLESLEGIAAADTDHVRGLD